MVHNDKYLYMATEKGLVVMDKKTLKQEIHVKGDVLKEAPSSLFLRGDTLWVGQRGSWITKFCGDSSYSFRVTGLNFWCEGGAPSIIRVGPQNELIMAIISFLIRVENECVEEDYMLSPHLFTEDFITGMEFDSTGALWISNKVSEKKFVLCRYTKEGGVEFIPTEFDRLNTLEVDGDDNIWLASDFCVTKYDGTHFPIILRTGSSPIEEIQFDKQGVLWILCRDGMLKSFDGETCTDFSFPLSSKEQFRRMDVDDSYIYISTNKRLLIFHDGEFSNVEVVSESSAIEDVQLCKDSRMPERIYNLAGQRVGATYKGIKINKVIR
ncbi:MAG: hypothetical protein J6Z14_08955 [Prevotella sp.]|nr:hypothetical protein [Prevotella sp.]